MRYNCCCFFFLNIILFGLCYKKFNFNIMHFNSYEIFIIIISHASLLETSIPTYRVTQRTMWSLYAWFVVLKFIQSYFSLSSLITRKNSRTCDECWKSFVLQSTLCRSRLHMLMIIIHMMFLVSIVFTFVKCLRDLSKVVVIWKRINK